MSSQPTGRVLTVEGIHNVRDLGGLPTGDGHRTVPGMLYRSANPDQLTSKGWSTLRDDLGVQACVDLRSSYERNRLDTQPTGPLPTFHAPAIEATTREMYTQRMRVPSTATSDQRMVVATRHLVTAGATGFAHAVSVIADHLPVLVHCTAGKDRTGIVTALILRVVGVPDDYIAADYAASTSELGDSFLRIRRELAAIEDGATTQALAKLATPADAWEGRRATPAVMHTLLAELDERFGGAEGYLLEHGTSRSHLDHLKTVLVDHLPA